VVTTDPSWPVKSLTDRHRSCIEGRSQAAVARDYGVSKGWVSELVARYRSQGDAAFQQRSRHPHTSPRATSATTVELILKLRHQLARAGLEASLIGGHSGGRVATKLPPKKMRIAVILFGLIVAIAYLVK